MSLEAIVIGLVTIAALAGMFYYYHFAKITNFMPPNDLTDEDEYEDDDLDW
jgi:hypothetical protein